MSNESSLPFQSDAHYRRLRAKLVAFFDRRRCTSSADLADETMARLLRRAAAAAIDNLDAVAFAIAKNVYREWLRHSGRVTGLDSEPTDDSTPGAARFRYVAEVSVGSLRPADRDFLEEYFIEGRKARDLASECGTTPVAIRGRVFRLRRHLETAISRLVAESAAGKVLPSTRLTMNR